MLFTHLFVIFAVVFQFGNGQNEPIAHHVVHIGIDGLRPDCIELAPGGVPNLLSRFTAEGSSTLTLGRTVTRTVSAAGWSATLASMPPELTGVKSNEWTPAWLDPENTTYPQIRVTPVTGNREPFPVVFKVIEEQEPEVKTAAFYSWDFFDYMTDEGYPGVVDHVVDCDYNYDYCDQNLTDALVQYLPGVLNCTAKSYSFIYLINVDETGHFSAGGWCGSQYFRCSSQYGSARPGIKQNYEFQYKVRNMDMVPTAVRVLGLEPSPWWEGTVMTEAFQDGFL